MKCSTYKVTQNLDTASRSADLVFTTTSGNVVATLTVTQLGGPGTDGLAVSPDSFDIGPGAVVLSSEVLTDSDWEWSTSASWITSQEGQTQSGSQTFAFNASGNAQGFARVGTITFTSAAEGDLTATITVTQFSSSDDDRDGLSNDEETKPFFIIEGDFTWEQARLDAIRRGGTLAVITTRTKADDMEAVLEH